MTVLTKFLALVNGALAQTSPVTVAGGSAAAGGIVGLNSSGVVDQTLLPATAQRLGVVMMGGLPAQPLNTPDGQFMYVFI